MVPVWGELPSWFMTGASCCVLRWWEESWSSRGLFYKGTYIVHEVSTWPKAHILTPSCLGLWYQYMNFGTEILRQFHGSRYIPLYLKILNSALNYHRQYYSNPITIFLNFILYWGIGDWQSYDSFRWTVRASAIHIQVSILHQTPLPSWLPDQIDQSSLCYIVGRLLVFHFSTSNSLKRAYIAYFLAFALFSQSW